MNDSGVDEQLVHTIFWILKWCEAQIKLPRDFFIGPVFHGGSPSHAFLPSMLK